MGDGPGGRRADGPEVASELGCDGHTVNNAVTTYGKALLVADRKRLNSTSAIGLDETAFVRLGRYRGTNFVTTVAAVENHQVIDIQPSRDYVEVARWVDRQPEAWKQRLSYGTLDMSATYAAVYSVVLPRVTQVVDPFHTVKLANSCLDAVRRRVQAEETGHRGRKDDPLYRARKILLMAEKRLDEKASERLSSLLCLGDPNAEVAVANRVKEQLRDFYATSCPAQARQLPGELKDHCLKKAMPPEVQKLGRTIHRWFDKLCNYHLAKLSNGPTETINNLIKRIKRTGFGFRNFENYRVRAPLCAGKPNWRVLGSIVVR